MSNKVLIIVNPVSGKNNIKKYISRIKENFEKSDFQTEIKYTSIENGARSIIKGSKEDFDMILICGGDGTLNQAIQEVEYENLKVPIGYIPTGTKNDFAHSINISFDKLHISKNINKYCSRKIDLGMINDRVFNYVVAFGLFSESSYKTRIKLKQKLGRFAYVLYGIKEIFNHKTYKLQIQSDTTRIEDEFIYGSISNSKYIGGFDLFKNKSIEFDDGKFEAVFVKKPKNFLQMLRIILKVLQGKLEDECIYYIQTSNLEIKCNKPIELSIDGEYGGGKKDIRIHVKKQSVEYLVPTLNKKIDFTSLS